jgi:hypothetical protein
MKMLLAPVALAGTLMTMGSGVPAVDHAQNADAQQPLIAVSHVTATHMTRIVDVEYQLSDQQRALIAYWRLKMDAERAKQR